MSAAEPVNPPPDGTSEQGGGAVIHLADHPTALRHRPERATGAQIEEPPAEQQLAEHMEALFNTNGLTLSYEPTALAFRISLEAFLMMLDGARAEGVMGEEEHRQLRHMAEGMRRVPHML